MAHVLGQRSGSSAGHAQVSSSGQSGESGPRKDIDEDSTAVPSSFASTVPAASTKGTCLPKVSADSDEELVEFSLAF